MKGTPRHTLRKVQNGNETSCLRSENMFNIIHLKTQTKMCNNY